MYAILSAVNVPSPSIRYGTTPCFPYPTEQPMTFLKEKRLWPLSLYLPEITSDKAGVAWAASIIMMVLPVVLFMMGQESLEQGIAASGIKE